MSGRSYLCDLWFSQTLRHKNYIYYYLDDEDNDNVIESFS